MFRYAYREDLRVLIAVADGTPNDDDDFQRLIDALARVDRDGASQGKATATIVVADGMTQPPSAVWRARIADLRKNVRAPLACVSFVTKSALLRGVGTAIAWLIPSPDNLESHQHATVEEAARWVEATQGTQAAVTLALYQQARA